MPPYDQETIAGAQEPPRDRSPHRASFDFARALRDPQLRRRATLAGHVPGITTLAFEADEPIGEMLRRFADATEVDEVLVAVRAGDGWHMAMLRRRPRQDGAR